VAVSVTIEAEAFAPADLVVRQDIPIAVQKFRIPDCVGKHVPNVSVGKHRRTLTTEGVAFIPDSIID
jgi:hypothetical protein